jgi:hypothetical protein
MDLYLPTRAMADVDVPAEPKYSHKHLWESMDAIKLNKDTGRGGLKPPPLCHGGFATETIARSSRGYACHSTRRHHGKQTAP